MYVYRGIYATENIVAYSDRRAKENIVTIDSALDRVLQMRGVFYTRIDDEKKKRQVGVIAQEIQEILPEVVTYCDVNDEYGVAYGNLTGILIEAVKDQNKIIEKQSEEIAELKEILNNLILNIKG
jgi:predicted RecB family endonuclease